MIFKVFLLGTLSFYYKKKKWQGHGFSWGNEALHSDIKDIGH